MKTMGSVLPWALVLAAIGGALWWMLSRNMAAGKWLLAALLMGHGLVHLLFAVPVPEATETEWPFDMTRYWLITGPGLNLNLTQGIGWALIAVTVVGFAVAAASTVGFAIPSGWWQPTVALAAAASTVLLVLFLTPQLVLGLVINAALVWVAAARVWTP
jgi:hypothetical protein